MWECWLGCGIFVPLVLPGRTTENTEASGGERARNANSASSSLAAESPVRSVPPSSGAALTDPAERRVDSITALSDSSTDLVNSDDSAEACGGLVFPHPSTSVLRSTVSTRTPYLNDPDIDVCTTHTVNTSGLTKGARANRQRDATPQGAWHEEKSGWRSHLH